MCVCVQLLHDLLKSDVPLGVNTEEGDEDLIVLCCIKQTRGKRSKKRRRKETEEIEEYRNGERGGRGNGWETS